MRKESRSSVGRLQRNELRSSNSQESSHEYQNPRRGDCCSPRARQVACAQFGSGIVFDPTQSGHAVQQIAQARQLYTTTVETTRNVIAAYNLAQRMASLPQTLYSSYSNLGRQEWMALTRPANTYGNSLPWMNAATTGYGAASANQTASLPQHWTDDRILRSQHPGPAGNCGTGGDGRSVGLSEREQFADCRNDSRERCSTRSRHQPTRSGDVIPQTRLSIPRWQHFSASTRPC